MAVGGVLLVVALFLGFSPVSTPSGRPCGIAIGPRLMNDLDNLAAGQPEGELSRCEKARLARQAATISLAVPGLIVFFIGAAGVPATPTTRDQRRMVRSGGI